MLNRSLILGFLVFSSLVNPAHAGTAKKAFGTLKAPATDQLIIRLKDDGVRRIQSVHRNDAVPDIRLPDGRELRFVRPFDGNGMVVRLPSAVSAEQAQQIAEKLASNAVVASVTPDKRFYPALVPSDPEYPNQWHLFEDTAGIRIPSAWDRSTGSAAGVIAVLDTGIIPHSDLNPARKVAGYDFITDIFTANDGDGRDPDPADPGDWAEAGDPCFVGDPLVDQSSWHGLAVTGVMVAQSDNVLDIAGIDFAARYLPVRVLGKCGGSLSDVADAIRWSVGLPVSGVPANPTPARVINLSLSGVGQCSVEEQNAINAARDAGAVVVVAAGNESADVGNYSPANCDNVIVVGALARDGSRASYTNTGDEIDLSAPAGDGADGVLTLYNLGTQGPGLETLAYIQGTSFTAGQVSAVASLMWAVNNTLSPAQVEEILRRTARSFPDASCNILLCGEGILNADAALAGAADPASVVGIGINTGGGGGGGCVQSAGERRFDPLLVLLMLIAVIGRCWRHRKAQH